MEIIILKRFSARRLYKSFSVKWLMQSLYLCLPVPLILNIILAVFQKVTQKACATVWTPTKTSKVTNSIFYGSPSASTNWSWETVCSCSAPALTSPTPATDGIYNSHSHSIGAIGALVFTISAGRTVHPTVSLLGFSVYKLSGSNASKAKVKHELDFTRPAPCLFRPKMGNLHIVRLQVDMFVLHAEMLQCLQHTKRSDLSLYVV
jgi:hypothetical protein